MKEIQSIQNPTIKNILKLQDESRERKKSGLFIIEGQREISLALKGDYTIKTILFCETYISESDVQEFVSETTELITISKPEFD